MKSYSRRELYALGEPFGNSSTTTKVGGGRIYGSGGGSSSQPTNQNYTTSNIAPWAQQGVSSLINSGMNNIYPNMTTNADGSISLGNQKGYVPFNASTANDMVTDPTTGKQVYANPAAQQALAAGQSQVAGFTPLQNQSFQTASNMQVPGQIADASNMAQQAGTASLNSQYNPMSASYNQVNGAQANIAQAQTSPSIQASQFQGPQNVNANNVQSGNFTGDAVSQYMNPYIQQSLNPAMQLINQQYGQQAAQEQAGATKSGAFGGSREALMGGLNQQNQMLANNQLVGNAYQNAYQNAQNQFNTSNSQNLQAQQANQGANLQANLANQNMGYNTGLQNAQLGQQASLANQQMQGQYGLANLQAMNQGNQFNAQNAQQASLANQQAQLQAQNQNINQQQFGANYQLQGLNQANAAAQNLGNLGQTQLAAQQGIAGLQNTMGAQQQQNAQNQLSFGAQNYANMQNAPISQLAQLESMYTGAPQNVQTLGYQAPPSLISQIGGLGMAGAGAYGLYNKLKAKGGIIKYSSGGIVSLGLHKAMKGRA